MMERKWTCIWLLFLLYTPLISQVADQTSNSDIRDDAETKYGPIAELINGEKYYYPYWNDSGDPFFLPEQSKGVDIVIRGRHFINQNIRYDIYNQFIVLDYINLHGVSANIALRNEWVDQFYIGQKLFRKYLDEDGRERFGQLIYESSVSCIYFWDKLYVADLQNGQKHYEFSDPIRNASIIIGGETTLYKSKKSFFKKFPKQQQALIKSYLREKGIKFKKVDDEEMRLLMKFINQAS